MLARLTLFVAALGIVATLPSARIANAARPNVLFITVDDMNWDSVGVFGCPVENITPNIDRLAEQGIRFEHAHVTIAICQPTRAVWMTGRYPHRNGALGFNEINRDCPTLLEALHDAGYFTGIMAKVPHVVPTRKAAWDVIVEASQLRTGRDPELYYQHSRDFFARAKDADKPFFLMANSQDPHRPFAGSQQERQRRTPRRGAAANEDDEDEQGSGDAGLASVRRVYQPDEVVVPGFLPDLPDVRREIAQYFTSVHRADEIVGSLLRALDESGLAEQTLVVFMSDHGMPLPFAKTNVWYNSTRTPWIVRWPGVVKPHGVDDQHMISGIDLAPTILDSVGLPNLAGADGRSIVPVLRGESQPNREFVFTSINTTAGRNAFPMRSVQSRKFGYIFNAWSDGKTVFKNESQAGLSMKAMQRAAQSDPDIAARVQHFLYRAPEEFYDYEHDPNALRNLIGDPAYEAQIAEYRKRLLEQMVATDDPQTDAFRSLLK